MITQQQALELFEYREGELYWKIDPDPFHPKAGKKAGSIENTGYKSVMYKRKHYAQHRIVYLMHHGNLPEFIDHIDNNKLNNRIENLRPATKSQNAQNVKTKHTSTSKIKGVSKSTKTGKWMVRLQIGGKRKCFGEYFDINVAKFVCDTMRYKYHKEFANHG